VGKHIEIKIKLKGEEIMVEKMYKMSLWFIICGIGLGVSLGIIVWLKLYGF
jgi:hypothetical protein